MKQPSMKPRTTKRCNWPTAKTTARIPRSGMRVGLMDTPETARDAPAPNPIVDPLLMMLSGALDGSRALDPLAMLRAQLESQNDPRIAMVFRLLEQLRMQEDEALKRLQEEAAAEEEASAGSEEPA